MPSLTRDHRLLILAAATVAAGVLLYVVGAHDGSTVDHARSSWGVLASALRSSWG
jgi:hypothetical protein